MFLHSLLWTPGPVSDVFSELSVSFLPCIAAPHLISAFSTKCEACLAVVWGILKHCGFLWNRARLDWTVTGCPLPPAPLSEGWWNQWSDWTRSRIIAKERAGNSTVTESADCPTCSLLRDTIGLRAIEATDGEKETRYELCMLLAGSWEYCWPVTGFWRRRSFCSCQRSRTDG